jgi:hypothetical protein
MEAKAEAVKDKYLYMMIKIGKEKALRAASATKGTVGVGQ